MWVRVRVRLRVRVRVRVMVNHFDMNDILQIRPPRFDGLHK